MKPINITIFATVSLTLAFYFFKAEPKETPAPEKEQTEAIKPTLPTLEISTDKTLPLKNEMLRIKKRFFAGDYQATATMIEVELNKEDIDAAYKKWLTTQYPIVLTSLGWLQISLADCNNAISTFRKSLQYERLTETVKGLAFCHHKLKNFNSSYEYFSQYLEAEPKDANMQLLYVDVLESRGDFEGATRALAKIDTTSPEVDKKDIEAKLSSMRAKTRESEGQGTISTNHFLFRYRFGVHDDLVNYFSIELEQVLDQFVSTLGFSAPKRIIEITFYPAEDFSTLVSHSPAWAQGLFDGRIRIPVYANADEAQIGRTLRHEMVHALLYEMVDGRPLPSWFNEGLAQRLECDGCGETQFPMVVGGFLNAKTLSDSFTEFSAAKAKVAYIQSLYLILNLERELKQDDTIFKVVSQLSRYSRLDSDSILSPLGIKFDRLISTSEEHWQNKKTYRW